MVHERSVGCTIARCATSHAVPAVESAREEVTLYGFRLGSSPDSFARKVVLGEWTELVVAPIGGKPLRFFFRSKSPLRVGGAYGLLRVDYGVLGDGVRDHDKYELGRSSPITWAKLVVGVAIHNSKDTGFIIG